MSDPAGLARDGKPGSPAWGRFEAAWEGTFLAPLLPRLHLDPAILALKVEAVYERLLFAMVLNLVLGGILLAFITGAAGGWRGELWLAASVLLTSLRYVDIRAYQRRKPGQGGRWAARIQAGALGQGALWAYACLELMPPTPAGRFLGIALLVAIAGAVVIFQSPLWSAYCLYLTAMMGPVALGLMFSPDPSMRVLGPLALVFIVVMAFASGSASRRLEDLLMAARINAELFEQRRREERQRQAQKLESLGVLAGGIAHDFNNLLGAVLGNLNLLQMQTPAGSPQSLRLATMEAAMARAVGLTRQMLAFSGGGAFVIQDLDPDQVIGNAQSLLQLCISKEATFTMALAAGGAPICADLGQLQQLLITLVTNASEALRGKAGEIWISTRRVTLDASQAARAGAILPLLPGEHVALVVGDSGEGMTPEVVARIFEPFFSTRGSGRGLGLSAVLGILRSHSAGITVQSRPGAGSTFILHFPVPVRIAPKESTQARREGQPFSGRVLLVDDEPTLLETAKAMLMRMGMEVETAQDGLDALERFRVSPAEFGLVILDLTMPRMDGHQTFQALRNLRPELPVILSSGYNAQNSAELLQGPGPSAFLQKPYTIRDLKKVVAETLG